MLFTHDNLIETFEGVRTARTSDLDYPHYIFSDDKGCDYLDVFVIDALREYQFVVDNFPFPRKFYNTNIPIRSAEEFISILKRMKVYIPHLKNKTK